MAAMIGLELLEAEPTHSLVRLPGSSALLRPGGAVAGPILFAMADIGTYLLTIAIRQAYDAMTSSLAINFLRPALQTPLLARAEPLSTGRRVMTFNVRITPEADPGRLIAQATATWMQTAL